MAPERGKTWFALLGFLSWKPMSGYDIKRLVDVSLSYFWSVSYGQIYPTLKRLVAAGYATVESGETQGKRARDVYRITDAGVAELDTWMKQPVDLAIQRDEMQLKLFVGGQRDREQTIELIRDFRRQQLSRLRSLEAEFEETKPWMDSGVIPDEFAWLQSDSPRGGTSGRSRKQAVREQSLIFLLSIRQGILKAEARIAWCEEAVALLTNPPYDQSPRSR